jgi:hypothetical protein
MINLTSNSHSDSKTGKTAAADIGKIPLMALSWLRAFRANHSPMAVHDERLN